MILGGPENDARVGAVEEVMARNGFEGPCFADLHNQGGGLWFLLIGVAPAMFLKSLAEAAGRTRGRESRRSTTNFAKRSARKRAATANSMFGRVVRRKPNGRRPVDKHFYPVCRHRGCILLRS